MRNIFQGNSLLLKTVARVLGYTNEEDIKYGWFTRDIYFSTFFYLTKRFGNPVIYDDYKDGGVWNFKVKQYVIQVYMNSSWVSFIMFGRIGNECVDSPYYVKYRRAWLANRDNLISVYSEKQTDKEVNIMINLFNDFQKEQGFDGGAITQEEFDKTYANKWFDYILKYNDRIINIDHGDITAKYGNEYQNAYTRHALKTLEQFLKNMLAPIWVRDVPYNIKGCISDHEAGNYSRYENNILITFENLTACEAKTEEQ